MNDTFNLSRLGRITLRHYITHSRHYLIGLLALVVIPWLIFGFFWYKETPAEAAWLIAAVPAGVVSLLFVAKRSFRGYTRPGNRVAEMTLPASVYEKYGFLWLNLLVVPAAVCAFLWIELLLAGLLSWDSMQELTSMMSTHYWRNLVGGFLMLHAMILFCYTIFPKRLTIGVILMVILWYLLGRLAEKLGFESGSDEQFLLGLGIILLLWIAAFIGMKRSQLK